MLCLLLAPQIHGSWLSLVEGMDTTQAIFLIPYWVSYFVPSLIHAFRSFSFRSESRVLVLLTPLQGWQPWVTSELELLIDVVLHSLHMMPAGPTDLKAALLVGSGPIIVQLDEALGVIITNLLDGFHHSSFRAHQHLFLHDKHGIKAGQPLITCNGSNTDVA